MDKPARLLCQLANTCTDDHTRVQEILCPLLSRIQMAAHLVAMLLELVPWRNPSNRCTCIGDTCINKMTF